MVTRRGLAFAIALTALSASLVVSSVPALATFTTLPPTGSVPTRTAQTDATDGGGGKATVGACHIYSNKGGAFGLVCLKSSSSTKTVGALLGKDPLPTCWDDPISREDMHDIFDIDEPDEEFRLNSFWVSTCVSGLTLNLPVSQQAPEFNQRVIELPTDPPLCGVADAPNYAGCQRQLTPNQKTVIGGFDSTRHGTIPSILLVTRPVTTVRTAAPVLYMDEYEDPRTNTLVGTTTNRLTFGNVSMWAALDPNGFDLFPYGKGTKPDIQCDGIDPVADGATPATAPTACWWAYPRSSYDQPNDLYPLHIETHWTVYYQQDGGPVRALGSDTKLSDIGIPVLDVEVLNVNP